MAKRRYVVKLWGPHPYNRKFWAVFVRGARSPIIVTTLSAAHAMDALERKLDAMRSRRRGATATLDMSAVLRRAETRKGFAIPKGFDH